MEIIGGPMDGLHYNLKLINDDDRCEFTKAEEGFYHPF